MTIFKHMIRACGLSHNEAADYLSVRPQTVKDWMAGRKRVPPRVLEELSGLFERVEQVADIVLDAWEQAGQPSELGVELAREDGWQWAAGLAGVARAQLVLGSACRLIIVPPGEAAAAAVLINLPHMGEG